MEKENFVIPNLKKSKSKRRHAMPQVVSTELPNFFKWAEKTQKIKTTIKNVDPEKLIPTQSEFNDSKIAHMIGNKNYEKKGIVISKDGYIVDGHHRWAAAANADGNPKIKAHVIDTDIDGAIELMKKYPKSFAKKLHEFNAVAEEHIEQLDEKLTPMKLLTIAGSVLHKKEYKAAFDLLTSILNRKRSEKGSKRHDKYYYAAQVAKQFRNVDARQLADMVVMESEKKSFGNFVSEAVPEVNPVDTMKRSGELPDGGDNSSYYEDPEQDQGPKKTGDGEKPKMTKKDKELAKQDTSDNPSGKKEKIIVDPPIGP